MTSAPPKPGDIPAQVDELPDGTVVISVHGAAYQRYNGKWWGFHATTGRPTLPVFGGPFTVLHSPIGTETPSTIEFELEQIAEEITVSDREIFINGYRFPWLVQENPEVVPFTDEMVALRVLIPTDRVIVKSNVEES